MKDWEILQSKLNGCKTVGQMLKVLEDRYELDTLEPGFLVKPTLVTGLLQSVKMLNPKIKKP